MGKGKPLPGDRAAWDAKNYPLVHTNDIDTLDGIHHTLGTDATQAAPGNHTHDDRYYTESETATLLDGKSDVDHTHTHFTDTTNPHSVTKDQVGLGNVANLKCNLAATSAPVASDDSADGYAVGSSWFDVTNDKSYLCLDATVDAAIWQEVGAGGGAAINVQEVDGTPNVDNVTTIKVTNGSLTDNTGGVITLDLGGASSLHDLTDVDDTGKANGDQLTYNSTTSKWEPEAPASNLDGLTDVVITTPATGQVLKYDGTNWKNDSDLVGTGGSDATAIHDDTAGEISLITEKTALADNDLFLIEDSAASYAKKKVKKSNLGIGDLLDRSYTVPILSGFNWVNQDGAVATQYDKFISLSHQADSANELYGLKKSLPFANNFQITIGAIYTLTNSYNRFGIALFQSSNGKIIGCNYMNNGGYIRACAHRWNSATSWNSAPIERLIPGTPGFLRIKNDGTNNIYYYSNDGIHWVQYFSESQTSFVTADEFGFFIENENGSYSVGVSIFHFKIEEL